jgi:hypothetical protein
VGSLVTPTVGSIKRGLYSIKRIGFDTEITAEHITGAAVVGLMIGFCSFMVGLIIHEEYDNRVATAAQVTEYRAKNQCLLDLIPKIYAEQAAPVKLKDLKKAENVCTKLNEQLAQKAALDEALK